VLVGIMGLLAIGWTGYRDFEDDTGREVGELRVRVAVLEAGVTQHERRIDMVERGR
jgi:hypothetical protein